MTTLVRPRPMAVPRLWARDGVFVGLSLAHAAVLALTPSTALIAIGLWWNANTIAHNFIHRPFFGSRVANAAFSAFLSLLLGVPQRLWRARHLAHHAERAVGSGATSGVHPVRRWRATPAMLAEGALVLALWAALAWLAPRFFLAVYAPGWLLGLGLCLVQGHFEHARGTTSHYGRIYNALFFNDGYHAEHHERPGASWTNLPRLTAHGATTSRWPPVLRWLDWMSLESLERLVLRWPALERYVVRVHERAIADLLGDQSRITRVTIVGGGLFPRTAIILRRLLPGAWLTIVDANATHLAMARTRLGDSVEYRLEHWDTGHADASDLVVIPLAFSGDRQVVYRRPPAPMVLVHDWVWNRRASGTRIAWLLLKRVNLVRR